MGGSEYPCLASGIREMTPKIAVFPAAFLILAALAITLPASQGAPGLASETWESKAPSPAPEPPVWVVSWAASQQIPEPQNALPTDDLRDTTLRLRISNAFGTAPLHLTSVHIAHPISPATSDIDPATDKPLTFAGHTDVT